MVDINEVIANFPKRKPDAHKGDLGHVLVVAGSFGYTGAAYLTSQAAMLSGSGLVTLCTSKSIYPILAEKLTEVMVRPLFETRDASISLLAEKDILAIAQKCDCLAIGPGLSQNKETQHLIRNVVTKYDKAIVLDADGINAFAGHLETLKIVGAKLVITPHPGEMARLIGKDVEEIQKERKDIALGFANEYNTVVVLKGHSTVVANPKGEFYLNDTGNAGMATGGVGDILTGIIAGFIAQGCDPFTAAVLGVYFHGLAGDEAVKAKGVLSLIASDLLQALPEVLKKLA